MDDPTEIADLLQAYQAKGMTADAATQSLTEMGYSSEAIATGLQSVHYPLTSQESPANIPMADNPDWTKVGNSMLTEKRNWTRTVAYSGVVFLGGLSGYQIYETFWYTKQTVAKSCQPSVTLPFSTNITCAQERVNPTNTITAAVMGAATFFLATKVIYFFIDRRIKGQEQANGDDPSQ